MDRQLRLEWGQQQPMGMLTLDAEMQKRLVALMAEAIVAIVESQGGEDDEYAGFQSQD